MWRYAERVPNKESSVHDAVLCTKPQLSLIFPHLGLNAQRSTMGFLENVIRGLTWFICGPKAPPPFPQPDEDIYVPPSVAHQRPHQPPSPPSYGQHAQQQNGQPVSRPPAQHRPSPPHGPRVVRYAPSGHQLFLYARNRTRTK